MRETKVSTRVFLAVMAFCLAVSLFFNGYLYYKLTRQTDHQSPTFFSFVFGPAQQNLTEGNLYLNLTFDVVGGNLTVKAEVNAGEYNPNAFLALQFDSDNNGTIDIRYWPEENFYYYRFDEDDLQFLLRVANETTESESAYWGWLPEGTIYFSRVLPSIGPYRIKSPFHNCLYNETKGLYTFLFSFPVEPRFLMGGVYGIQGKLVRVLYGIEPPSNVEVPEKGMTVYVPPFKFLE